MQREPAAILLGAFKTSQRHGFNFKGIEELLQVFKERHDIECYYLRTGRDFRDGPSSTFYCKGNREEGGLGQRSPRTRSQVSWTIYSPVLYTPITASLVIMSDCVAPKWYLL